MNVIIRETNERHTLSIIAPDSGIDYVQDFIGNTGALIDGQFVYDEDVEAYTCDPDTYEWWSKVCADNEALEERIYQLKQEHGSDAVDSAIGNSALCDLEDLAASVNTALDEAFGEEA